MLWFIIKESKIYARTRYEGVMKQLESVERLSLKNPTM